MEATDTYTLRGKTGWAIRDGNSMGWFVGYLTKQDKVYYFATRVEPQSDMDMEDFPASRMDVTMAALQELGLL